MIAGRVLGIETSCDETAAAVVEGGRRILSNLVASQVALHAPFRGVVPEIAARAHEAALLPLIRGALDRAGVRLPELEGVAVTVKPGLIGALLVGMAAAKGIAAATGLPLTGVNHLEAHAAAAALEGEPPPLPALALVASGGHTCLLRMEDPLRFSPVSTTTDDAAGEAFDKVAALLDLPYPGGPAIEKAARAGRVVHDFPVARVKNRPLHFSFSGIKTAVLYHLRDRGWGPLGGAPVPDQAVPDIAASFQEAVVRALVETTRRAARETRPASVLLAGGVALNGRLREAFAEAFAREGLPFRAAPPSLCGDNAAMVAALGALRLRVLGPDPLGIDAQARALPRG